VGQHEIMYIDERSPRVRNALEALDSAVAGGTTGVIDNHKPS
jgi:hypothetical protein